MFLMGYAEIFEYHRGMAESSVQVRKLFSADAEAFRSIRLEALQQSPDAFGSTFEREFAEPLAFFVERVIAQAAGRVELIELTVVTTNTRAVHFYRKMRFSSYGIEKRALKYDGVYFDEELMVRFLNSALLD